mgnify:CR=1 FL=1
MVINMKKIISLFVLLMLVFTLFACGGNSSNKVTITELKVDEGAVVEAGTVIAGKIKAKKPFGFNR